MAEHLDLCRWGGSGWVRNCAEIIPEGVRLEMKTCRYEAAMSQPAHRIAEQGSAVHRCTWPLGVGKRDVAQLNVAAALQRLGALLCGHSASGGGGVGCASTARHGVAGTASLHLPLALCGN